MSWLSDAAKQVSGGETSAQRRARRAKERELASLRAIGPTPTGSSLELEVGTPGETPEERRRRLRKLARISQTGGDIYGELSLGNRGLLAR